MSAASRDRCPDFKRIARHNSDTSARVPTGSHRYTNKKNSERARALQAHMILRHYFVRKICTRIEMMVYYKRDKRGKRKRSDFFKKKNNIFFILKAHYRRFACMVFTSKVYTATHLIQVNLMIWVDLIWFAFDFIEGNYASYDSFIKMQHHFMHINFRYFLLIVYKLVLLMLKVKNLNDYTTLSI